MRARSIGLATLAYLVASASALAQVPFLFQEVQGQTAASITNGATITFVSTVGQTQSAVIQATYTGTGHVAIAQQPQVLGSASFGATIPSSPVTLLPGNSVSITISFAPSNASLSTAQLSLPFTETTTGANPNSSSIAFTLDGTVPAFTLSYLSADQNVVSLPSGSTLSFPPTLVGASSSLSLTLTNTGSGAGGVSSISSSGSAFQLQGLPAFPATLAAGQSLQFTATYTSTANQTDSGQLTIRFSSNLGITVSLTGSGTTPTLSYQIVNGGTLTPGQTIAIPPSNVGQPSTVTIRVLNSGSVSDTVSSIAATGTGFLVGGVTLPQTLAPNASFNFTITFTPTQPGAVQGTLTINSDSFKLSGSGLGTLLSFAYTANGTTIALSEATSPVVFSPVAVTQSELVTLTVTNAGTAAAAISNIGIGQTNSPFSVAGLPSLPVTIQPNASITFTVAFQPITVGFVTGTLLLDATTLSLMGSGNSPPALPAYVIQGPNGNTPPMAQPLISLALGSPYPVAISGTLKLSTAGLFPADPAVQFVSGGQSVDFTIPANQTLAVFGAYGTQIGMQTGTVATTLTLTPSFATLAGGVDLTPPTPTVLQFSVASAPPALLAIQIADETNTPPATKGLPSTSSFSVQVTGYATARSLGSLAVQLTTAAGFSMPTSKFTIDLTEVSSVWFGSTASQAFGGQFQVTVPFTFQATVPAGQSVLSAISSVSVTMSNQQGASNTLQASLE